MRRDADRRSGRRALDDAAAVRRCCRPARPAEHPTTMVDELSPPAEIWMSRVVRSGLPTGVAEADLLQRLDVCA